MCLDSARTLSLTWLLVVLQIVTEKPAALESQQQGHAVSLSAPVPWFGCVWVAVLHANRVELLLLHLSTAVNSCTFIFDGSGNAATACTGTLALELCPAYAELPAGLCRPVCCVGGCTWPRTSWVPVSAVQGSWAGAQLPSACFHLTRGSEALRTVHPASLFAGSVATCKSCILVSAYTAYALLLFCCSNHKRFVAGTCVAVSYAQPGA